MWRSCLPGLLMSLTLPSQEDLNIYLSLHEQYAVSFMWFSLVQVRYKANVTEVLDTFYFVIIGSYLSNAYFSPILPLVKLQQVVASPIYIELKAWFSCGIGFLIYCDLPSHLAQQTIFFISQCFPFNIQSFLRSLTHQPLH